MKLSEILKYSGITVGAIATLVLVFSLVGELVKHPINVIIIGIGAATYFAGKSLAKKGK